MGRSPSEAEILEHRISDLFVERLIRYLIILKHVHTVVLSLEIKDFEEKFTVSLLEFEPGDKVTTSEQCNKTELLVYLLAKIFQLK